MNMKSIMVAAGSFVLGGIIFTVATSVLPISLPFAGGKQATAAADAPAKGAAAGSQDAKAGTGIMYEAKSQVVNLADPGGYRYLRVQVVLEFDGKSEASAGGGEGKKTEDPFAKKMQSKAPLIDNEIISLLTSKRVADIISADGKERLREELKERLSQVTGEEHVRSVYFREFVVQ